MENTVFSSTEGEAMFGASIFFWIRENEIYEDVVDILREVCAEHDMEIDHIGTPNPHHVILVVRRRCTMTEMAMRKFSADFHRLCSSNYVETCMEDFVIVRACTDECAPVAA